MENQSHLMEIQADDHDLLVNSDNENDDMLGYESERYSNDKDADGTNHAEDADGTNHSDLKLVKRGITRLYKFRREYGKPGGIKIKVDKESRDKLWDEITRYIDVDLTVRKLVLHRLEADDKIKEGNLNIDDGTDAMTVVFGKEKEGYVRGVGSGVTYKRYFHLSRSKQATDERIELLQTQLDNERRERQQKRCIGQEIVHQDDKKRCAYEVDETQSTVVVRDKDARIQLKCIVLVTSEKEPVKTIRPKKTPKSRRNGSQDSQSQGNVSPTQELPTL
nr:hypothetical protein [Tanacetum cinerariifolium]